MIKCLLSPIRKACLSMKIRRRYICYLPAGKVRIGKNLCPRYIGRGPCSRPRARFFPIRTDLGRQITYIVFSLWKITLYEIFVLIFYWLEAVSHRSHAFDVFSQANPCCLQKYLKEETQFSLISCHGDF